MLNFQSHFDRELTALRCLFPNWPTLVYVDAASWHDWWWLQPGNSWMRSQWILLPGKRWSQVRFNDGQLPIKFLVAVWPAPLQVRVFILPVAINFSPCQTSRVSSLGLSSYCVEYILMALSNAVRTKTIDCFDIIFIIISICGRFLG